MFSGALTGQSKTHFGTRNSKMKNKIGLITGFVASLQDYYFCLPDNVKHNPHTSHGQHEHPLHHVVGRPGHEHKQIFGRKSEKTEE